MKKPEILSPAGDPEALLAAARYGADAVYVGGTSFSMRASPKNFTIPQLGEAAELLHSRGKRLYVACNILPRSRDIAPLARFLEEAAEAGADAFIVGDLGVLELCRRHAPGVDIHISTQAGVVNYAAANALYSLGAKRVVLARELSLAEIAEIRRHTPEALELEAFVHGAMCVSFSGRCLLSEYLTGRDGNRGDCAQPCRWKYALYEEKRPGQYLPMREDDTGTYFLNARDLCMIGHLPRMLEAGVTSLKIEGRSKSAYYTAAVTNAYRMALDQAVAHPDETTDPRFLNEVYKVSNRGYCTGFYFGPIQNGQEYDGGNARGYDVVAAVIEQRGELVLCRQRNVFRTGETLEALEPGSCGTEVIVEALFDDNAAPIEAAITPDMIVFLKTARPLAPGTFLRRPSV